MKKVIAMCSIVLLCVLGNANLFAATTQVDEALPLGAYDVTNISFDYHYGGNASSDEFQVKGSDGSRGYWSIDVNFDELYNGGAATAPISLDTDYGPYVAVGDAGDYVGTHHYNFTLNNYTGLFSLAVDGSDLAFMATDTTNAIQPDGAAVTAGNVVANMYYSDESTRAYQNAADLGWTANADGGVGGYKQYRLRFYIEDADGGDGDSYGAITTTCVPEPMSMTMLLFGLGSIYCVAFLRRRKWR